MTDQQSPGSDRVPPIPEWARALFATPRTHRPVEWNGDAPTIADIGVAVPFDGGILDLRPGAVSEKAQDGPQDGPIDPPGPLSGDATQDATEEVAFWEATADSYDDSVLQGDKPHAQRRMDRMVRSVLDPTDHAGRLTLEVGTGTGDMTVRHIAGGRQVVACDLSLDMLRIAKTRLDGSPNGVLVGGDMLAFPFRDGVFDSAIGLGVLHHIPEDMPRFFEGLLRVLRPGGCFAFREPSWYNLFNRYYFDWNRSPNLSPNEMPLRHDDMIRWARQAGFHEVTASLDGLVLPQMPSPMAWFAERLEPWVRRSPAAKPLLGGFIVTGTRPD